MQKIDILSLFKNINFSFEKYLDRIIEIGDITAIRKYKGISYRRNYERGLLILAVIETFGLTKFLEFGTGRGFSVGCALLSTQNMSIYTIDNTSVDEARFLLKNMNFDLENVVFIKENSRNLKLNQSFDFVFIDGGHDYKSVKNDYEIAERVCKKGIILFDDFRNKHPGVKRFIKEVKLPKILVNTQGWIVENKMISKTKDADGLNNGKEHKSGQVIVPIKMDINNI